MKESIKIGVTYELSHEDGCNLKCTRYGEAWRDLTGDNLVLQMFQRIQELEEYTQELDKYERAFNTITDESVDEVLKYEE